MVETFFIYAMAISFFVFLLYLLGVSLAPYLPSKVKNEHFECGLPPSSSSPKKANFGFFTYAIMFVVADMVGLFFTLFVYARDKHSMLMASIFALIMALAFIFASKELQKGEYDVKNS
ncbi:MAG: NADH-quinone oxidoreductase subunit A [Sulfurovum sp.]